MYDIVINLKNVCSALIKRWKYNENVDSVVSEFNITRGSLFKWKDEFDGERSGKSLRAQIMQRLSCSKSTWTKKDLLLATISFGTERMSAREASKIYGPSVTTLTRLSKGVDFDAPRRKIDAELRKKIGLPLLQQYTEEDMQEALYLRLMGKKPKEVMKYLHEQGVRSIPSRTLRHRYDAVKRMWDLVDPDVKVFIITCFCSIHRVRNNARLTIEYAMISINVNINIKGKHKLTPTHR